MAKKKGRPPIDLSIMHIRTKLQKRLEEEGVEAMLDPKNDIGNKTTQFANTLSEEEKAKLDAEKQRKQEARQRKLDEKKRQEDDRQSKLRELQDKLGFNFEGPKGGRGR